jgi:RNA polymerase-binding protein DksA
MSVTAKAAPAQGASAKTAKAAAKPPTTAIAKTAPIKSTATHAPTKKAADKPTAESDGTTTATSRTATKVPATKVPVSKVPAKKSAAGSGRAPKQAAPAVRNAEWTDDELAQVRIALLTEMGELDEQYASTVAAWNDLQQLGSDSAGDDQADAGAKTFEREQELSIAANRRALIDQIQHAIERIDARTYGLCENCGKLIPKARLQAFPMATLDVACKAREERR